MNEEKSLKKKLDQVKNLEKNNNLIVDLNNEIDISSSPTSKRCSFPYSVTPYKEFIKKDEMEKEIK